MNSHLQTLFSPEVDIRKVTQTLGQVPDYVAYAKTQGFCSQSKLICARRQDFEREFRRYLLGKMQDLTAVDKAVEAFQAQSPRWSSIFMALSLAAIKQQLLDHEWYELLPRYRQAVTEIHCQFYIPELARLILN